MPLKSYPAKRPFRSTLLSPSVQAVERCFYASSAAAPAAADASAPTTCQREGTEALSGPRPTASENPDPSHVSEPGKHIGTDDSGPGVGADTEGGEKHGTDSGCSRKENMESEGIGAGTGAGAAGCEESGGGRKGSKGAATAARLGGRGGSSGGRGRKRTALTGGAGAKHEGATEAANEEA